MENKQSDSNKGDKWVAETEKIETIGSANNRLRISGHYVFMIGRKCAFIKKITVQCLLTKYLY